MRGAAEISARRVQVEERGGLVGKVQAIVFELPGMTTREIREQLEKSEPARGPDDIGPSLGSRVSGALNRLKLEGTIEQVIEGARHRTIRWVRAGVEAPARILGTEVFCIGAEGKCGTSILFGSLATEAERARPTCSIFPFVVRGAA